MKKNKFIFLLLIFVQITLFYSCNKNNGTSTGNPLVNLNITGASQVATAFNKTMKRSIWDLVIGSAYAFPPPATMMDSTNLTVILSEFWLSISEIELKYDETAPVGEVNGDGVEYAGPFITNIFATSPTPLASAILLQSSIRRIKYKTANISDLSSGAPAGMLNSGIYLSGVVNGNNFIFVSGEQLAFETAGPNLVTFSNGDHLLMQIQTADLIRKIDLSAVTNGTTINETNRVASVNPCPSIDVSAADVYTCFIKGLQTQTKVGKDDGDNKFSIGEDTIN